MANQYTNKYNWIEIQEYYDLGYSVIDVGKRFGAAQQTIITAGKNGKLKLRSAVESRKAKEKIVPRAPKTEEHKRKLSESMTAYLKANPDKIGFLRNHWRKRKSWAEQQLENALIANGIVGWKSNLPNGIYFYDFGFSEIKLDVEVDGATHLDPKIKAKDAKRDMWSLGEGWTVMRFTGKEIKNDLNLIVSRIQNVIELL